MESFPCSGRAGLNLYLYIQAKQDLKSFLLGTAGLTVWFAGAEGIPVPDPADD